MESTVRSLVLLLLVVLLAERPAVGEEGDADLHIQASVSEAHSHHHLTRLTIGPDGSTRIVKPGRLPDGVDLVLTFRLSPKEMDQARVAVAASRFFDSWCPEEPRLGGATWQVAVRLGDEALERTVTGVQPEFVPLEHYLYRFLRQARTTAVLRRGVVVPRHRLRRVAHPAALVPEIVACAAGQEDPRRCADVARLLLEMPAAKDWLRGAEDLLTRLDGDRRGAVLAAWARELRPTERAEHRAVFTPLAVAEVTASWMRWASMTEAERLGPGLLLAVLLDSGVPQAFEIAEDMARTFGTPEKGFVPWGLIETGEAAVPIVVRLLDAREPGARASGAEMAYRLTRVVRKKRGIGEPLSDATLAALEHRFGEEVVPALERRVADVESTYAVRTACFRALDRWDGRVETARLEAQEAAAARRAREKAERSERTAQPRPAGTLTISGCLLGPADLPLPGFRVHAWIAGGRFTSSAPAGEDGSFVIDGLAAGRHDLRYTRPGRGGRFPRRGAPPIAEGVVAGAEDVVLRLPGSLIRGRLLDAAGAPVAGRRLVAEMRDRPNEQWATVGADFDTTDAQGRFWFLSLIPGVYDVQVPGHLSLGGASGIETGPDEKTIRLLEGASISGRVLDETGEALADVHVSLSKGAPRGAVLQGAQTRKDGCFRLIHLEPGGRRSESTEEPHEKSQEVSHRRRSRCGRPGAGRFRTGSGQGRGRHDHPRLGNLPHG